MSNVSLITLLFSFSGGHLINKNLNWNRSTSEKLLAKTESSFEIYLYTFGIHFPSAGENLRSREPVNAGRKGKCFIYLFNLYVVPKPNTRASHSLPMFSTVDCKTFLLWWCYVAIDQWVCWQLGYMIQSTSRKLHQTSWNIDVCFRSFIENVQKNIFLLC